MKHRTILLLIFMLASGSWLVAQQALWWDDPPPQSSATRDHSISYGNGFAWLVALGTSGSEDFCWDATAVSSGGFLVVGANYYYNGYDLIKSNLVLYRLTEEGELLWEKGYGIEDYKVISDFAVIEKPHGGFFITGIVASNGYVPSSRKGILIKADAEGDTLFTMSWARPPDGLITDLRMTKSTYDDSFFLSYKQREGSTLTTEMFKLSYNLDTLAYTVFPNYYDMEYAPKPFGYIHKGQFYDNLMYFNRINFQGEPIDSFPDPIGISGDYNSHLIRFRSLRNGNNYFIRIHPSLYAVFVTAIANDGGELLYGEPFHNQTWWFKHASTPQSPYEFSDGSICQPFPVRSEWNDAYGIGLVKLNSMGQLLGDTFITRGSNLELTKVLEGADGRPIIFGTTENGPFGGTLSRKDIFIAKLESWNPVDVPTVNPTDTQPLRVYPNPFSNATTIHFEHEGVLNIYDLNGTNVYSEKLAGNSRTIDLSFLKPGVYLYRIVSEGNISETNRMIKL